MKWYPGYMSAPHSYATDRLSLVLSGTWWVNSGADFDPNQTVFPRCCHSELYLHRTGGKPLRWLGGHDERPGRAPRDPPGPARRSATRQPPRRAA